MIGNVFNLSGKIPLYVLRISLELLWATYYTFDNKNNLNDYNIMKLSLCQKRRVVNKLFLCLLLSYLCNHIFLNDVIFKKVFFLQFFFLLFPLLSRSQRQRVAVNSSPDIKTWKCCYCYNRSGECLNKY